MALDTQWGGKQQAWLPIAVKHEFWRTLRHPDSQEERLGYKFQKTFTETDAVPRLRERGMQCPYTQYSYLRCQASIFRRCFASQGSCRPRTRTDVSARARGENAPGAPESEKGHCGTRADGRRERSQVRKAPALRARRGDQRNVKRKIAGAPPFTTTMASYFPGARLRLLP